MEKSFALQLAFAAVALAVIVAMLGFMAFLVLRNKVRDEDCPIDFLMAKANSCAMSGPLLACYRLDLIVDPPSLQQRAKEIALSFLKHEMIIAAETLADVWDIIGARPRGLVPGRLRFARFFCLFAPFV